MTTNNQTVKATKLATYVYLKFTIKPKNKR